MKDFKTRIKEHEFEYDSKAWNKLKEMWEQERVNNTQNLKIILIQILLFLLFSTFSYYFLKTEPSKTPQSSSSAKTLPFSQNWIATEAPHLLKEGNLNTVKLQNQPKNSNQIIAYRSKKKLIKKKRNPKRKVRIKSSKNLNLENSTFLQSKKIAQENSVIENTKASSVLKISTIDHQAKFQLISIESPLNSFLNTTSFLEPIIPAKPSIRRKKRAPRFLNFGNSLIHFNGVDGQGHLLETSYFLNKYVGTGFSLGFANNNKEQREKQLALDLNLYIMFINTRRHLLRLRAGLGPRLYWKSLFGTEINPNGEVTKTTMKHSGWATNMGIDYHFFINRTWAIGLQAGMFAFDDSVYYKGLSIGYNF